MKANARAIFYLMLGVLTFLGCSQYGEADKTDIRNNYTAVRDALIATNSERANALVASYIQSRSPERLYFTFGNLLKTNFALTSNSYIEFSKSETNKAWLWPFSKAEVGTTGFGFTKETNGWRINGEFLPVMH